MPKVTRSPSAKILLRYGTISSCTLQDWFDPGASPEAAPNAKPSSPRALATLAGAPSKLQASTPK